MRVKTFQKSTHRNCAKMFLLKTIVIFAFIGLAFGEVIDINSCPDDDNSCTISEVRVNPCPEAIEHRACKIRRRRSHTMSFDFTTTFDADALEASLVWVKEKEELPLITLERNGCLAVTPSCPVRANQKATYAVEVPIEKKFPASGYTIKWQLKAPSGQKCCFMTDIRVVR